jgi:hypothetical protein
MNDLLIDIAGHDIIRWRLRPRGVVGKWLMSMHASIFVDSVGPPSAEICRTAASFP